MKKFLPLFTLLMLVSVFAVGEKNYLNYAEYLADKEVIVRQRPVENYALTDKVLRQEVIGVALRLTGLNFRTIEHITLPELYTCGNLFSDVRQNTPNTWACRSIETAVKHGIITGKNREFRPEADITRAEAIAMMLSAVKLMPTVDEGEEWTEVIMQASHNLGILTEKDLDPDEKITR